MDAIRKTKIVCTMGPSTKDIEVLKGLLHAGMNVARFNFSHGDHAYHAEMVALVRRASGECGLPVALMLDTRGPEIRTGMVRGGAKLVLREGSQCVLTTEAVECQEGLLSLSYLGLPEELKPGNHVFIADGLIDLEVLEVKGNRVITQVVSGGEIGSRKNVNVPGVRTKLPSVGEGDESDIRFGVELGFDLLAASFIRKPEDVRAVRRILEETKSPIRVIAKIEDEEGLSNIEEIIHVADGIMVARGDLGVQLASEEIPLAQKRIIQSCRRNGRPVITATQMLESMTRNPRPTRAEVSDVANAIFDGTDAVMLSGETASGDYPVEAARMMHRIAVRVEGSEEYQRRSRECFDGEAGPFDVAEAACRAAYSMARDIGAKAIVTPTVSGLTARTISRYRPPQPIVAVTPYEDLARRLMLDWGLYPLTAPFTRDSEEMIQNALMATIKAGYARDSEKVVVAAGLPVTTALMTNTVRAYYLGRVVGRGAKGFGGRCTGRLVKAGDFDDAVRVLRQESGEILLTRTLDRDFIPILRLLSGVILEGGSEMSLSLIRLVNPDIVFVAEVAGAMDSLENGMTLTLDGGERLVYEGVL